MIPPSCDDRKRSSVLTEAGALLARDAGDLLTHAERVAAAVAEHRGAVAGTVTIAAFAIAARGLPPSVLRDLRSRHPDLSASLSELEPHEAIPALERGHVDVALVQDWADDVLVVPPELCRTELMEDLLDVAQPADIRSPAGTASRSRNSATRTGSAGAPVRSATTGSSARWAPTAPDHASNTRRRSTRRNWRCSARP